jgi:uncharacterized protein YndB with AHSA1/START domain
MTETRSIVIERELPHTPEKVWRALTQSHLMAEWLMNNDFEPVIGRKFNFRAAPMPQWNGVTDCEVRTIRPFEELSYSWKSSGEEAATGVDTIVTWTLTPMPGGVRLRMEQSGFQMTGDNFFQGAAYGWQHMLGTLEQVLAKLD